MSDEIELIADGDGLAIIGETKAVERLLLSAGVQSRDLRLNKKLGAALNAGSTAAQAGSHLAANSGRWVKLTEESAKALKLGNAMNGSSDGLNRAIATTSKGKITKILEFTKPGSVGSLLTSPAMLAGAAGLMAQLAMQQTMEEITNYLAVIDEKVDDVLRAQKDAVIAEMIGVAMVIDDAMRKREHVGRVSSETWSSLHGAAQVIASTQAHAVTQLDAVAEKMELKSRVGELDKFTGTAEATVEEWLGVLARCFQLQDGLAVLELDRVLDSSPADIDGHRAAIRESRQKRRDFISESTSQLLLRMETAAANANRQVLLHPFKANRVVRVGNGVAESLMVFHERLGIAGDRIEIAAKPWREAVGETRDSALGAADRSVRAVGRFGAASFEDAKSGAGRLVLSATERLPWRKDGNPPASSTHGDESTPEHSLRASED